MKTLTVKNPWAWLILAGIKDIENRTWYTNHRGKLLIHSSKQMDERFRDMSRLFTYEQFESLNAEQRNIVVSGIFPMQSILGSVDLVDCVKNSKSIWAEQDSYHWIIANPKPFIHPIVVKGSQGLWNYQ